MPSLNTISADKLARLIGRPDAPALIDVCTDEDFACDPRLVPGALRRPFRDVDGWAAEFAGTGRPAVVICQKGLKLSQGVAAWLRHLGVPAEALEGGALGWAAAGLPMVPVAVLPPRDARGRTVWVTRAP
jgi:rhodanese-related sulfurtransferase